MRDYGSARYENPRNEYGYQKYNSCYLKRKTNKFLYLFVLSTVVECFSIVANAANILAVLPSNGRSHFKPVQPFLFDLARRGHNLTVISNYPPTSKPPNYHQLNLDYIPAFIADSGFGNLRKLNRYQNWMFFHDVIHEYCFNLSRQNVIQNLIRSKDTQFDLIFTELYLMDGFFALADRFDCPIIGISFQPMLTIYHWLLKNPITFSYIPHSYSPYSCSMNVWQKFNNFLFGIFTILHYNFVSISSHQKIVNNLLESQTAIELPNIVELTRRRLTMVFEESHFTADHIRPHLPNVIDVAGIHLQLDNPLPQDIDNFINEAPNGVIYISFGSLIEPKSANHLTSKLVNIIKKLPYRVIWKWDPSMIDEPRNDTLLIRQWLPQNDILRHPKCVLFVSHGGYHSLLEAINSGVPIVGLPFFTDQYHNMAIAERLEVGRRIDPDATTEDLKSVFLDVLSDQKYKINAKKQSVIFKDRPQTPLDTAVYWTEYVLRHKGSDHMRSSAIELYWFQYLLLDLTLILVVMCFILVFIVKILLRNCLKICYSNSKHDNLIGKSSKKD